MSLAAAATFPDSATQGPNPQDIATPEPEYIDIDLPEAAPAPKAAPQLFSAPQVYSAPAPQVYSAPVHRFAQYSLQTSYGAPVLQHISQPQYLQQLPGHYHGQSGYQYRRPVYIRRIYRRRY